MGDEVFYSDFSRLLLLKAVILAGGFGKRLRPFTNEKPKPMLRLAGRPLIEWQIQWLKSNGISDLVICVGYLKEIIMEHVGNGSRFGVNVRYSSEEATLGTGGAIKNAQRILFPTALASPSSAGDNDVVVSGSSIPEEDFFVINGDILTTIDLSKLVGSSHHTVCAVPMRSPYGVMIIAEDVDDNDPGNQSDPNSGGNKDVDDEDPYPKASGGFVTAFLQKPTMDDIWINAGIYYFKKEIFDYLPEVGDFEASVLPLLARQGKLKAVRFGKSDYYWRSIDSHWDLEEASKEAPLIFQQETQ